MAVSVPPQPEFGESLPIAPSQAVIDALAHRRSASALTLRAPGPTPDELVDLLRLAARAPDHGKLNPWRFVILKGDAKAQYARSLETMAAARPDAPKATAALGKLKAPPLAVAQANVRRSAARLCTAAGLAFRIDIITEVRAMLSSCAASRRSSWK